MSAPLTPAEIKQRIDALLARRAITRDDAAFLWNELLKRVAGT